MASGTKEIFGSQKLLLGVTGSIGTMLIPQYLIALMQLFKEIKVIMTPAACQFVPLTSIQYICKDVYADEKKEGAHSMSHVELASWGDMYLVLPATANTIAHAAHGFAHNLLTQTLLCFDKPVFFFPNMNGKMWVQESLQRNIALLKKDGHIVCPPVERDVFVQASRTVERNYVMPSLIEIIQFIVNSLEEENNSKEVV